MDADDARAFDRCHGAAGRDLNKIPALSAEMSRV